MNEEYHVFEEWTHFDGGGMNYYNVKSKSELETWIKDNHPDPEKFIDLINDGRVKIIRGSVVNPIVKETTVIKSITV